MPAEVERGQCTTGGSHCVSGPDRTDSPELKSLTAIARLTSKSCYRLTELLDVARNERRIDRYFFYPSQRGVLCTHGKCEHWNQDAAGIRDQPSEDCPKTGDKNQTNTNFGPIRLILWDQCDSRSHDAG